MSGKANMQGGRATTTRTRKTSAQKDVEIRQDQTDAPGASPLAPVADADGQTAQPETTTQPVATDPQPDTGLTATGVDATSFSVASSGDEAHLQAVQEEMATLLLQGHERAFRTAADAVVLEVRAIPENGFRRAGRFWSHENVHVFVSDNPDELVIEDDRGRPLSGCVISMADAKRLKAEKMLIVTELATVTAPGTEDA